MALGRQQIARTFIQAGGNRSLASLMSDIALRESAGRARINNRGTNSNGTTDWGLWQINDIWRKDPVVGPLFRSGAILTPRGNAKAAVRILAVQGPRAWSTYNAAKDSRYLSGFGGAGPLGHRAGNINRAMTPGRATRVSITTPGATNRGLSVPAADLSGLSALLSPPETPQVPYASPLAAPAFSGQKYLPGSNLQLPATQMPSTQTDGGLAAKLADIGSLSGPSLTAVAGHAKKTSVVIPATGQPGTSPGITAPGSAPDALRTMIERANAIDAKHYAYEWGGGHNPGVKPTHGTGHGSGPGIGYDCSGVVSKVLGVDARVSGEFERWGQAGKGKSVTVYANGTHVLMEINGHFFGTSSTNPGGGAGWIKRSALPASYLKNFVARHPNGM